MNKEEEKKLREIIKKGKWNYVLTYGGRFAFIIFVLYWLSQEYIFHEEFYVLANIIICGIAGLIFGLWCWSKANKDFKKL